MAISLPFIDAHIAAQTERLTSEYYPHRKYWPTRLFHHAPLENAVAILQAGVLRSRSDPLNPHPRDVAAPGVIDARNHAHDRVRLYFRPKTPTQYHIEGIQRAGECNYVGAHAPVLVMFALDARSVLSQPDIMFSNQNMQLGGTVPGTDEEYFSQIPFTKVFSEGGIGGDRSIIDARAAEVLTTSPLELSTCLREIYFRSEPERDTVLHMLGEQRAAWSRYCHVSDALKVFEKKHTFVQEVGLTPKGVVFRFNPRFDRAPIDTKIQVWNQQGQRLIDFYNSAMAAKPEGFDRWIWNHDLPPGRYTVKIELEGSLAYLAEIPLDNVLF